jgi:two-component sensor histidine kinase
MTPCVAAAASGRSTTLELPHWALGRLALNRRLAAGLRLCVLDEGRGLPAGFDITRKSIGMTLVTLLAGQLHGEIAARPGSSPRKVSARLVVGTRLAVALRIGRFRRHGRL